MILKSLLGCRLQKILITVFYFDVFVDLVMNPLKRKDRSIRIFDSMFYVDVFVDLVMIPYKGKDRSIIRIERLSQRNVNYKAAHYVAEGPFKGIVINKAASGQYIIRVVQLV